MSARPPTRVDVGVVTWNTAELTAEALRRLVDTPGDCELRVLVHDNASDDGTAAHVAARVPEAEVVAGPVNLGFARAVNLLLERSDAPWFFALNSDAWPEAGAIDRLVARAVQFPRAAAVAPLLLRPDGTVEHSTHPFPTPGLAALDVVGGRRWLPSSRLERRCLEGTWRHDRARKVDWAVGAALLMRRAAVDAVGPFDERFFMYAEDLEWCWRASRHGWQVHFDPSAVVRHVGNASGTRRFGAGRAALEVANVHRFLCDTRGPAAAVSYRALAAVSGARQWAAARARRDAGAAHHWRVQVRAQTGLDRAARACVPTARPAPRPADAPGAPGGRPGADLPVVSVVVATRGRAALLPRLVAAVEAQTVAVDDIELVVVDDASPDETAQTLARLGREAKVCLRVVTLGVQQGRAAARNHGWRAARAPVVAFTDDDCVPDPDWLAAGLACLEDAPRLVVGRTEPPEDQRALAARPFGRLLEVHAVRFYETCNIFYRRRDLAAVGGFDERYRTWGGEDTDLGLRVVGTGVEARYAPGALVHHDVSPGSWADALRAAGRGVDLGRVVAEHPEARGTLLHRQLFWKRTHPTAIVAAAGLVAAMWRPRALALVAPWVYHRVVVTPACPGPRRRVVALPGALVVDLAEVATMARSSIRHRTVIL
ncbi:MAG TPA: glycosyltransferase [Acidimicrobiales bacterium]|nr:glycosyltransferase [Acidimicrobiales bacterium]